jgi:hypothetical protein
MGWKPIETMPFDTDVLVYHEERELIEIRYRSKDRPGTLYPGGSSMDWWSHWMPLPDAP